MLKISTHRLIAIIVFALSFWVYAATMADSESFWDCGEFTACSFQLGVPHPPGTPIFLLLGRFFSMLPISSDIAVRVTYMSVLASALAIMLAYLINVQVIRLFRGREKTPLDEIITYGGAAIGALALSWSYSMWFNAVESEVYASSQFFTHIVVWLMLVWNDKADEPDNTRWLLLIAYVIGIAIGVHLLNVLTIPALALIYYFRRYKLQTGSFVAMLAITLAIVILVYPGLVKWLPQTASTVHISAPFIVTLAVAALFWWCVKNKHGVIGVFAASSLLIIIGYSAFLGIYIRSGMNPGIDENDPDSPARFFSYLNREQYGDRPIFPRMWNNSPEYRSESDYFWRYQVNKMFNRYLFWQFIGREGAPHNEFQDAGVSPKYSIITAFSSGEATGGMRWLGTITCLPFILGLAGFLYHFSKDKKGWFIVGTLFFMTGYAILLYLNQDDPQPRERDYSYVGAFFAFTIWIAIGAAAAIDWVGKAVKNPPTAKLAAYGTTLALLLLCPVIMLAKNYEMNDRSGNFIAEDYSTNMLQSCDQNGILFTNGDNDTFPVWYMQEVKKCRTDVRVANLSLLNTGWYIKQLKDREPKVPISFSDSYIDRYLDQHDRDALLARYWPPEKQKIELNTPEGKMNWTMPAAMYIPISENQTNKQNNFLRVQDIMILDILRTNYDPAKTRTPKPIYFAVTCANSNMIGLRDYMTFEGLVFRINPKGRLQMDPDRIKRNLFKTFDGHYRGINDPKVHFDDNVEKLLQNYRSGFLQLAYYYMQQPDSTPTASVPNESLEQMMAKFNQLPARQKALCLLMKMDQLIPESVRPISNVDLSIQIGKMYYDLGRQDELRRRLDEASNREGLRPETKARLAAYWTAMYKDSAKANALLGGEAGGVPSQQDYYSIGRELFGTGDYQMAAEYFEKAYAMNREDGQTIGALLQCYQSLGNMPKAKQILEDWVARHPSDRGAKQRLDEMSKQMGTVPSTPTSAQ
jgi:hypothetical protein